MLPGRKLLRSQRRQGTGPGRLNSSSEFSSLHEAFLAREICMWNEFQSTLIVSNQPLDSFYLLVHFTSTLKNLAFGYKRALSRVRKGVVKLAKWQSRNALVASIDRNTWIVYSMTSEMF